MEKQTFIHKHDKGTRNIPVLRHEIEFCNKNVKPGQGWYFQTSPYIGRRELRRRAYSIDKSSQNNRPLTRGRLQHRLKGGLPFPKKMIKNLSEMFVGPGIKTIIRKIIHRVLGGRALRLS